MASGLPDWLHALPLAGYMLVIVYLFHRLLPPAFTAKSPRTQLGAPRRWELAAKGREEVVHGALKGVTTRHVMIKRDDGVMSRVARAELTREDVAYVEARQRDRFEAGARVFLLLALLSLLVTWTYMLQYFALSAYDHASKSLRPHLTGSPLATLNVLARPSSRHWSPFLWLRDVSLFDEAWSYVCATPARWLLSSQLTLFAIVAFTPLLLTSDFTRPRQGFSLLVLGQIVAISVATALAFRLPRRPSKRVSPLIWPSLIGATVLTGAIPAVSSSPRFLPTLLGLHALLFLPLVGPTVTRRRAHLRELYLVLSLLSTFVHLHAFITLVVPSGTVSSLRSVVDAFLAHPAQGSIGSDALACAAIWLIYVAYEGGLAVAAVTVLAMPFVGLAGAASAVLTFLERDVGAVKED